MLRIALFFVALALAVEASWTCGGDLNAFASDQNYKIDNCQTTGNIVVGSITNAEIVVANGAVGSFQVGEHIRNVTILIENTNIKGFRLQKVGERLQVSESRISLNHVTFTETSAFSSVIRADDVDFNEGSTLNISSAVSIFDGGIYAGIVTASDVRLSGTVLKEASVIALHNCSFKRHLTSNPNFSVRGLWMDSSCVVSQQSRILVENCTFDYAVPSGNSAFYIESKFASGAMFFLSNLNIVTSGATADTIKFFLGTQKEISSSSLSFVDITINSVVNGPDTSGLIGAVTFLDAEFYNTSFTLERSKIVWTLAAASTFQTSSTISFGTCTFLESSLNFEDLEVDTHIQTTSNFAGDGIRFLGVTAVQTKLQSTKCSFTFECRSSCAAFQMQNFNSTSSEILLSATTMSATRTASYGLLSLVVLMGTHSSHHTILTNSSLVVDGGATVLPNGVWMSVVSIQGGSKNPTCVMLDTILAIRNHRAQLVGDYFNAWVFPMAVINDRCGMATVGSEQRNVQLEITDSNVFVHGRFAALVSQKTTSSFSRMNSSVRLDNVSGTVRGSYIALAMHDVTLMKVEMHRLNLNLSLGGQGTSGASYPQDSVALRRISLSCCQVLSSEHETPFSLTHSVVHANVTILAEEPRNLEHLQSIISLAELFSEGSTTGAKHALVDNVSVTFLGADRFLSNETEGDFISLISLQDLHDRGKHVPQNFHISIQSLDAFIKQYSGINAVISLAAPNATVEAANNIFNISHSHIVAHAHQNMTSMKSGQIVGSTAFWLGGTQRFRDLQLTATDSNISLTATAFQGDGSPWNLVETVTALVVASSGSHCTDCMIRSRNLNLALQGALVNETETEDHIVKPVAVAAIVSDGNFTHVTAEFVDSDISATASEFSSKHQSEIGGSLLVTYFSSEVSHSTLSIRNVTTTGLRTLLHVNMNDDESSFPITNSSFFVQQAVLREGGISDTSPLLAIASNSSGSPLLVDTRHSSVELINTDLVGDALFASPDVRFANFTITSACTNWWATKAQYDTHKFGNVERHPVMGRDAWSECNESCRFDIVNRSPITGQSCRATSTPSDTPSTSTSFSSSQSQSHPPTASESASPSVSVSSSSSFSESTSATPSVSRTISSSGQTPSSTLTRTGSPSQTPSISTTNSVTSSPTATTSKSSEPTATVELTQTATQSSSLNPCDEVRMSTSIEFLSKQPDVSFGGEVLSNVHPFTSDGNLVVLEVERTEFSKRGRLLVEFHFATDLRNFHSRTSSDWFVEPLTTNCDLSDTRITNISSVSVQIAYKPTPHLKTDESYLATIALSPLVFQCQELAPFFFNASIKVKPRPRFISEEVLDGTETAAVVTSALAGGVTANPSLGLTQARMGALLSLSQCQFSHTQRLGKLISPTGYGFGAEHGYYYRGAVIGNIFLFVGISGFFVLLAFIITATRLKREESSFTEIIKGSFADAHLPSVLIVPVTLGLEGSVSASFSIFLHATDKTDVAYGFLGIGSSVFIVGYMIIVTTLRFRCELHERGPVPYFDEPKTIRRILKRIFYEPKKYVSPPDDPDWKKRNLLFFCDYRLSYYLAIEMVASVVLGLIDGVRIADRHICQIQAIFAFLIFFALFLAAVIVRPALMPFNDFFMVLASFLGTVSAGSLLIAFTTGDDVFSDADETISIFAVALGMAKFLVDVGFAILWAGERKNEIVEYWLSGTKKFDMDTVRQQLLVATVNDDGHIELMDDIVVEVDNGPPVHEEESNRTFFSEDHSGEEEESQVPVAYVRQHRATSTAFRTGEQQNLLEQLERGLTAQEIDSDRIFQPDDACNVEHDLNFLLGSADLGERASTTRNGVRSGEGIRELMTSAFGEQTAEAVSRVDAQSLGDHIRDEHDENPVTIGEDELALL